LRCQAGYPADDATTGASRTRGRARGRNHAALAPPAPPPPPVLPRLSRLSRLGDAPAATARRPTPPAARRRRRAPARPSGSAAAVSTAGSSRVESRVRDRADLSGRARRSRRSRRSRPRKRVDRVGEARRRWGGARTARAAARPARRSTQVADHQGQREQPQTASRGRFDRSAFWRSTGRIAAVLDVLKLVGRRGAAGNAARTAAGQPEARKGFGSLTESRCSIGAV
jgi:hypothetical protein